MTKKVKVTIKAKRHIIEPVESHVEHVADTLLGETKVAMNRYAFEFAKGRDLPLGNEIKKAGVPNWTPPTPTELMGLSSFVLHKDVLAKHAALSAFAFGVKMAELGEMVLQQAPTQAQIEALIKTPGFVDRQAVQFAQAYMFQGIRSKDQQLVAEFQQRLIESLQKRQSPVTLAREMAAEFDQDYAGWLTIARSETARSLNEGILDETERLGKSYVYIPESPRCCQHCMRLIDGRVFPASAIRGQSNVGISQKNWGVALPLHPNCLHFAIPASRWLVEKAKEKAGGEIPNKGVRIEYVPPNQRITT